MTKLESQTINIPCPHCAQPNPERIVWLKTHPKIVCTACKKVFETNTPEFAEQIDAVQEALSDLKRSLTSSS